MRGSKLNLPVPVPVSVFPLVGGEQWGRKTGGEGSRCSLKDPCDLPGGHRHSARFQAVLNAGFTLGQACQPRGWGGGGCACVRLRAHQGGRAQWRQEPITGLAKAYLRRLVGKQAVRNRARRPYLWGVGVGNKNRRKSLRAVHW